MYQLTTTADQRWSCNRGGNEGHSLCWVEKEPEKIREKGQRWRCNRSGNEGHSLCWLEKSPSLMVCGCSSSPTGAVMLTLNFCSPAHTSKAAGCVVSLKLMPIRTEVDAPTPKEATEWKRAEQNQIKLRNISFTQFRIWATVVLLNSAYEQHLFYSTGIWATFILLNGDMSNISFPPSGYNWKERNKEGKVTIIEHNSTYTSYNKHCLLA